MEEIMREWMARQTEANERIKGETQRSKSFPHTTNSKPRHEFVYNTPLVRNKNDKGNVEFIQEDETQPFQTMPKPSPIVSNSPNVSPFLKNCTVRIPYTNSKTFADDALPNHVGDKELKSYEGIGTGRMTRKKVEKDDNDVSKEPNKD
uniref:Uncharacterized protein n=1 Tax=Tanacetum cinerariifolium TaxID=118510 RepID=A0A699GQ22_TANCI|nr:hypothetical protein [Tanacetum cinerariifolium]